MNHTAIETQEVKRLKISHRSIYTDIIIEADAPKVWEVLTDTASYKNWATFLIDIQGEILHNETITAFFQVNPEKEKINEIAHRITVKEGSEFYWSEKGPGGIVDNHHFKVVPLEKGRSRFIQSDELKGGLTFLLGGNLSKMYLNGYQAFNRALKKEVESRSAK